ncbi:hypothetical protein HVZ60_17575 [Escherichia coli]|nr:hypothetical protein [Escherichia coli]
MIEVDNRGTPPSRWLKNRKNVILEMAAAENITMATSAMGKSQTMTHNSQAVSSGQYKDLRVGDCAFYCGHGRCPEISDRTGARAGYRRRTSRCEGSCTAKHTENLDATTHKTKMRGSVLILMRRYFKKPDITPRSGASFRRFRGFVGTSGAASVPRSADAGRWASTAVGFPFSMLAFNQH